MSKKLIIGVLSLLLSLGSAWAKEPRFWIWDGNGTDGKSGTEGNLQDPGRTDDKSGITPPQTFFTAPPRQYEDVDPEEGPDSEKKSYSPYALIMVTQPFKAQNKLITRGNYLVKLGDLRGGSPATHSDAPGPLPPKPKKHHSPPKKKDHFIAETFIFKQSGKVIGVLPIEKREPYIPPKGTKPPKKPVATIVEENHTLTLKIYFLSWVYSSSLLP